MPAKKTTKEEKTSGKKPKALPTYSDRTHKIADLALKIMGLAPRLRRDSTLLSFGPDESLWDADFEAARRRAEMLLDDIEGNRGDVDAYQLFQEDVVLSCEEMAQIFKTANWNGLFSTDPVRKLMRRIELKMQDYREVLLKLTPPDTAEVAEEILNALDHIGSRDGVRRVFPSFMKQLNEFITSMHNEVIRATELEAFEELVWFTAFSEWCIEKEENNGKLVTKYRAHELLRFAKQNGWESASLLKASKAVSGPWHPKIHPRRLGTYERFIDRESFYSTPVVPDDDTMSDKTAPEEASPPEAEI